AGRRVAAPLPPTPRPLGVTIGNAVETREALAVLMSDGPDAVRELTLRLGVEMLRTAGLARGERAARTRLERALADGSAFERFLRMVRAHGGDPKLVEHPERLPVAKAQLAVAAPRAGVVAAIDALELGWVSVALGAGRTRADQAVDPAAGIEL